jgi:hypothetical protein
MSWSCKAKIMCFKTAVGTIFQFFILHLFPRSSLLRRLRRRFEVNGYRFTAEFSGRVALYRLARAIRSDREGAVALIPDYICNVVNIALEQAGFDIRSYTTDDRFEPIRSEIEERLLVDDSISVFLTANVYGSSAFLQGLHEERFRDLVLRRNIHVVVDLCQDISLVDQLPVGYGQNLSSVISFNDKSIPGIMGGGMITRLDVPLPEGMPSLSQTVLLYRMLILKRIKCLLEKTSVSKIVKGLYDFLFRKSSRPNQRSKQYAYSYCRSFPYTIANVGITKIQIIAALIGLRYISQIESRKRRFALSCPKVVATRYYDSSPYLVVSSFDSQHSGRKRKRPYAVDRHPEQSLRSDLKVIHNKGFCDVANQSVGG